MFSKLLFRPRQMISFKDMKKSFFEFLSLEAGAVYRGAPEFRQRKYMNVEISQKFKELEVKRKQEHLIFAEKRKKLLEQRLSTQAKLLTESQKSQLNKLDTQIKSLQQIIQQQNKQLAQIEKNLQQTQAEYILIQGPKKLVVLNTITHLKHLNSVPSGVVLTPQAIKVVQNVHYLVTHNLPVQRFKLYELMPDMFTKQIGELQESVQRLIVEKSLNIWEETTSSSIRRWARSDKKYRDPIDRELIKLIKEREDMMINLSINHERIMQKHLPYIQKVLKGQTPFRNIRHCYTALMSTKLNLTLTQQQQAFKKTVQQIMNDLTNFQSYCKQLNQRAIQIQYSYIEPPPYVKNHPVLMQLWDKHMQRYTNPILKQDFPGYLPDNPVEDDGRAFMDEKIRKEVEKHDQEFVRLWHEDKSKLMANKKQLEIEFYNMSTRVLEEYQALEDKSKKEQQEFKKLPKRPKRKQQKYVRITMDQLTKMIFLNKKNSQKYNLDFFSKYFGMEEPENKKYLFDMLNSVSYLRVMTPDTQDPNAPKEVRQEVLKFVG